MAQLSPVTESSFFSSIVLWFGRNNVFSRLSSECQAREAQLYRGWFWEDVSVHANIFSLGLNGIQSICGNFTECTKLLMKSHSGLPTFDHPLKPLLNFAQ